jgi:hypothetical protein
MGSKVYPNFKNSYPKNNYFLIENHISKAAKGSNTIFLKNVAQCCKVVAVLAYYIGSGFLVSNVQCMGIMKRIESM